MNNYPKIGRLPKQLKRCATMKKIIVGILFCFLIAVINSHVNLLHISWNSVETLYTVVGVMFSVGMSLIISVSTSNVHNLEAKKDIRRRMGIVTHNYVIIFAALTFFFVLFNASNVSYNNDLLTIYKWVAIRKTDFITLLSAMSIIYYVVNFMTTQSMNREIEDVIEKEKTGTRNGAKSTIRGYAR